MYLHQNEGEIGRECRFRGRRGRRAWDPPQSVVLAGAGGAGLGGTYASGNVAVASVSLLRKLNVVTSTSMSDMLGALYAS